MSGIVLRPHLIKNIADPRCLVTAAHRRRKEVLTHRAARFHSRVVLPHDFQHLHPADRLRFVLSCPYALQEFGFVFFEIAKQFIDRHSIHSACSLILLYRLIIGFVFLGPRFCYTLSSARTSRYAPWASLCGWLLVSPLRTFTG